MMGPFDVDEELGELWVVEDKGEEGVIVNGLDAKEESSSARVEW